MSEKLEFTGERFTPECEREIWYEHLHRYAFAARCCHGARVLDAACGEGYGSAMLSILAEEVTGVDNSSEAVEHARRRYAGRDKLSFALADCVKLPFEAAHFDAIVSFETLEHLSEQEQMMAEFRRVLRPDGFLILSSPDRAEYSEKPGFTNEFHVRELYRAELEQLIGRHFPAFRLLGQKLMFHSAIWEMDEIRSVDLKTSAGDELLSGRVVQTPMYFIALCAASGEFLPDPGSSLSLFGDAGESVYNHYQHEIRKNMAAGAILAERDAEIRSLQEKLAKRKKPWWQRLFSKG